MEVELPATGCNIIQSSDTFYNYSQDGRTRSLYVINDGKAILRQTDASSYGYSYNGTCLDTGDLIYRGEYRIFYEFISFFLVGVVGYLLFQIIYKRLRWTK